jgi:RsiW-degrading membrane proteinase PrsW (M82 family)
VALQPEVLLLVAAALAPAGAFTYVAARSMPQARRSWVGACTAFAWGMAIAAPLAALVNDAADTTVAARAGAPTARLIVRGFVGPAVEEVLKAIGLLAIAAVARRMLGTARAGATAGAMIGLGFAAMENITYYTLAAVQAGYGGVLRAVYLRGLVQGAVHPTFTAVVGAAVGAAAHDAGPWSRRARWVAAGLAASIAVHATWNALSSVAITRALCNAPAPDAACAAAPDDVDLFLTVPAIVAVTLGPVLGLLAARLRRHAA